MADVGFEKAALHIMNRGNKQINMTTYAADGTTMSNDVIGPHQGMMMFELGVSKVTFEAIENAEPVQEATPVDGSSGAQP